MKKEIEEEEVKEVSVSLSLPVDDPVTRSSGLSQSATDRTKYFEPQEESCEGAAVSANSVEFGDSKEKLVPVSPDGLSCSPSTFHSSLTTASTSVIVPGTFTQKSSKEKVLECFSYMPE